MDTNAFSASYAHPHPNVQQQRQQRGGSAPTAPSYGSSSAAGADAASFFGGGGAGAGAGAGALTGGGGGRHAAPPVGPRPAAAAGVMPPPVAEPWAVHGSASAAPPPRMYASYVPTQGAASSVAAAGRAPAPPAADSVMPVVPPVDFNATTVSHGAKIPAASAPSETTVNFPRENPGTGGTTGTGTVSAPPPNATDFFASAGGAISPSVHDAVDGGAGPPIPTPTPVLQHPQTVAGTKSNGHGIVRGDVVTPGGVAHPTTLSATRATMSAGGKSSASDFFGSSSPATKARDTTTPGVVVPWTPSPSVPPTAAVAGSGGGASGFQVATTATATATAFEKSTNDHREDGVWAKEAASERDAQPTTTSEDVTGTTLDPPAGAGAAAPQISPPREDGGGGVPGGATVPASPREDGVAATTTAIDDGQMQASDGRTADSSSTPTVTVAAAEAIEPPRPGAAVTPRGGDSRGSSSSSFGRQKKQQPYRSRPTPPKPKLPLPPPTTPATTRSVPPVQHHSHSHRRARSGSSGSASSATNRGERPQRAAAPKFRIPPPLKLPKPPTSSGSRSISDEIKSLQQLAAAASTAPTSSPPVLPPPRGRGPGASHAPAPAPAPVPVPVPTEFSSPSPPGGGAGAAAAAVAGGRDDALKPEGDNRNPGVEEVMRGMVDTVVDRTTQSKRREAGGLSEGGPPNLGGEGSHTTNGDGSADGLPYGSMFGDAEAEASASSNAGPGVGGGGVAPEDDVPADTTNDEESSSPPYPRGGAVPETTEEFVREAGEEGPPVPRGEPGVDDAGFSEGRRRSDVVVPSLGGPFGGDDAMNEIMASAGIEDADVSSSGGGGGAMIVSGGGGDEGGNDAEEDGPPPVVVPSHDDPADEQVAPTPPLPPGWAEFVDGSSGRAYYYNDVTGETTWERPELVVESALPAADGETTEAPHRQDDGDGDGDGDDGIVAPEDDVPTVSGGEEGADHAGIDGSTTGVGRGPPGEADASVEGGGTTAAAAAAAGEGPPPRGGHGDPSSHHGWETEDLPDDDDDDDDAGQLDVVAPELDVPTEHVVDDDEGGGIVTGGGEDDHPGGDDGSGGIVGADVPAHAAAAAASEVEGGGEVGEDVRKSVEEKEEEEDPSSVDVSSPQLPPGWREVFDPASGRAYYYDEGSGMTTWERPPPPCHEGDDGVSSHHPSDNTQRGVEDSQQEGEGDEDDEADEWCLVGKEDDEDGGTALGETQQEVVGDEKLSASPEDGDGDGAVAVPGPVPSPTIHEGHSRREPREGGTGMRSRRREEKEDQHLRPVVEKEEGGADVDDEPWGSSRAEIDAIDDGGGLREEVAGEMDANVEEETTDPSSSSSPPPPLPPGWVESVDPSSGRPYYWHEGDGVTTWERPVARADDAGRKDDSSPAVRGDGLVPESEEADGIMRMGAKKGESSTSTVEAGGEVAHDGDAAAAATSRRPPDGGIAATTAATTTARRSKVQRPPHALVSFGFGGRLCVMRPAVAALARGEEESFVRSDRQREGVATGTKSADANRKTGHVHVFRLHHLVDPRIVALPSISEGSFFGPWISATDESSVWAHLRQRCEEEHREGSSCVEGGGDDEPSQILWKLIRVAALSKGRLRSDGGAKDPHGPEAAVISILLGEDGNRQGGAVVSASPQEPHPGRGTGSDYSTKEKKSSSSSSAMDDVQTLLLRGGREEAVRRALDGREYALALLVATMCDRRVYENAARRFVDEAVNPGSPLHTLSMLFSGQLDFSSGDRADDPGEGSSSGTNGFGGGITPKTFWGVSGDETLLHNWRYHLASILSNRTRGWDKLVRALGDQLLRQGSVVAAHFCYMVCGCPVSALDRNSRLVLVGCDCSSTSTGAGMMHAALMTRGGVESYERTEAFEWAKRRGNPTAAIPALQGFKLRYAMLLADFGYEERARLYVESIRSCTGLRAGGGVSKASALYPSTFLDEIGAFEDRVCVSLGSGGPTWDGDGAVGKVGADSVSNVVSSAFEDMSSLPIESRKEETDVGDGGTVFGGRRSVSASPNVHHDVNEKLPEASVFRRSDGARFAGAREALAPKSETGVESKGTVSSISRTEVAPPVTVLDDSVNQLRDTASHRAAPVLPSVESSKVTNGDKKQDSVPSTYDASNPFAVRQSSPDDSVEGTPAPASISGKEAVNEVQSDGTVRSEDVQKFSSPFGHVPSMAPYPSATTSKKNKKGPSSTSGGQSLAEKPHRECRDDSNLMGSSALPESEGKGIQSAPPSIGKPTKIAKYQLDTPPVAEKVRAPPKSEGSILSKTKKPPSSGNSDQAPSSESSSWWRSKITKLLNPNATVCDIGSENQAYYDEKLKRWIFPGDDPNEVAKPLAPPPTTPMTSNPPAGPVLPCDDDDPLAALMAPPPRASATRSVARANYPVPTMRPASNLAETPSSDAGMKATPKFPSA